MSTVKTPHIFYQKRTLSLAIASIFAAVVMTGCRSDDISVNAPNVTQLPQGTVSPTPNTGHDNANNANNQGNNTDNKTSTTDPNGDNNQLTQAQKTAAAAGFFVMGKIRDTSPKNDPDYSNDLKQQWLGKLYVGIDAHRPDGIGKGKNLRQPITANDIKPLYFNKFPALSDLHLDSERHRFDPQKINTIKVYGYGNLTTPSNNNTHINHQQADNKKNNKPVDPYENIRFGYLELQGSSLTQKNADTQNDQDRIPKPMPILFYHGENASSQLPSAGKFNYTGNWLYLSDVKKRPALSASDERVGTYLNASGKANEGDVVSAAHIYLNGFQYKHTPATYQVDFDTNSLTGKLSYYDNPNQQNNKGEYLKSQFDTTKKVNETDVYQIDAKINGNRFVGTAKSLVNKNTKTAPFIKELFSDAANPNNPNPNSDTLEGGFYGKSGDELAGKFLSNDNATFVVFGGKRDKTDKPVATKTVYFSAGFEKPSTSFVDNETIGGIINSKGLNNHIDEDEITPSDNSYYEFIWGKPEKQFTKKVSSSTQVVPAYFGQHDKFYFNGNYYDLSASRVDKLAPADAVKANQSIKEKYPNATLNKDKVTTIVLQEASGDKPYTAIHAKSYDHISFGEVLYNDNKGNPTRSYFVQGGRADASTTLPSAGKFTYNGLWAGYLTQKKDKGYSNKEEIIKEKGHPGYLLTEDFTPEEDDDGSLVASADLQDDDAHGDDDLIASADPQDDGADDADDDGADNVYQKGEIRPEFANKHLPINEPTHEKTFALDGKNKAKFEVDFNTNSLTGNLNDGNGDIVFNIKDGKIDGTGFTAKADVSDYRHEIGNNSSGGFLYNIKDIDVKGQFFGTNGEELAGQLQYDKGDGITDTAEKAGAVFGAVKETK
ncbi:transferrin-binding protein-like solute binding protein [Moraxella catarrhalis]|uniref:transferrin-binding protein-like solute binding protein n=1 Tax=Moraxella catarrhalis TaxID=480 RepID=UPI00128BD955|nr:transferrin-binding protein-like solute binding protein [Moraxella catarrhalis]MPW62510.1 transferrin-binding protein-like solute binding protein [Moraxella catarrhalis]MPX44176.1 transferrin-binding protein-like solute binding protein [Moraxella catarrhalis]MPX53965.1 transferrin-binding protein-like solute binding protein [Moraxella catarrhalis]